MAAVRMLCQPAPLLLLATLAAGNTVYSKLEPSARCSDYLIPNVATKEECFGIAATSNGLDSAPKVVLNGIGFAGCVYNTAASTLMYGTTGGVTEKTTLAMPNLQYLCEGVPTTTTKSTFTGTTATTSSSTALIHKLEGGQKCMDFVVTDIPNADACFNQAAPVVGLNGKSTLHIDGIGFTGCVFNTAAQVLMYGETNGVGAEDTMTLPTFEYVCAGILQTTTETTSTETMTTTMTTTITTLGPYTFLEGNTACVAEGYPMVESMDECFNMAGPTVGLSGKTTMELNGIGFTGCVYNSAAETLMYGITNGVDGSNTYTLHSWNYLCRRTAAVVYP